MTPRHPEIKVVLEPDGEHGLDSLAIRCDRALRDHGVGKGELDEFRRAMLETDNTIHTADCWVSLVLGDFGPGPWSPERERFMDQLNAVLLASLAAQLVREELGDELMDAIGDDDELLVIALEDTQRMLRRKRDARGGR